MTTTLDSTGSPSGIFAIGQASKSRINYITFATEEAIPVRCQQQATHREKNGHPSLPGTRPAMLNFGDQTRTGVSAPSLDSMAEMLHRRVDRQELTVARRISFLCGCETPREESEGLWVVVDGLLKHSSNRCLTHPWRGSTLLQGWERSGALRFPGLPSGRQKRSSCPGPFLTSPTNSSCDPR